MQRRPRCSGVPAASPLVACGVFAARSFVVQLLEHFGGAELPFGLLQLLQLLLLQVCRETSVGLAIEMRPRPITRQSSSTDLCFLSWLQKVYPRPFPWRHREKSAFTHQEKKTNWNAKKCFFVLLQRTSACPDPGYWWSGSSGRWWTPARPAASALCPGPLESSHNLEFYGMTAVFKAQQKKQKTKIKQSLPGTDFCPLICEVLQRKWNKCLQPHWVCWGRERRKRIPDWVNLHYYSNNTTEKHRSL